MNAKQRYISCRPYPGRIIALFLAMVIVSSLSAQQYYFNNYNVEQGLAQSQAQDIYQDGFGYIWITTFGGLSRFDGTGFRNFYRKDGLQSLICFTITHNQHTLYLGTQSGLQIFRGDTFEACELPPDCKDQAIQEMIAVSGHQYCRIDNRLAEVKGNRSFWVTLFQHERVTALASAGDDCLLVAVEGKGIYKKRNDDWQLLIPAQLIKHPVKLIYGHSAEELLLLTDKSILKYERGKLTEIIGSKAIKFPITSMVYDNRERLWLGTTRGCYVLHKEGKLEYVGENAGLTDNAINDIMIDREGNCWFATDGDGIFKLNNAPLYTLGPSDGMKGHVVMGLARDKQHAMWVATSENGLQRFVNGEFVDYPIPSSDPEAQKANSLLMDSKGNLWIGTLGGGLWKRTGNRIEEIRTSASNSFHEVISIYEGNQKDIWVCTSSGVFFLEQNSMRRLEGITQPCFSVYEKSADTLFVASTSGLIEVIRKSVSRPVLLPHKQPGVINCIRRWKEYILLGTEDAGLIFWNPGSGERFDCTTSQGLLSNFIFSIFTDSSSSLYVGTGNGIGRINLDESMNFRVTNFSTSNHLFGPECNLNAVQKDHDGKLWFGTTRGVIVYDPQDTLQPATSPYIYLTNIKLFSQPLPGSWNDTITAWTKRPSHLNLAYKQNQLSFEFAALWYSNPAGVKYWYMLEGADTGYSQLGAGKEILFSNLAPGNYHFRAYAETVNGRRSLNSIDIPFFITAPFYQQTWFRVLAIVCLLLTGAGIQYIRTSRRARRIRELEKIRQDEQLKIQERTSEDLHDDLGNRITRITVLADVLKNKISAEEPAKRKLVEEIRENAASLYLGTKDIIWSLTPGNNTLYDILERCQLFAGHLFEDTGIEFTLTGLEQSYKNLKVPVEIQRNIMMIVKEALNNTLKHAGASTVSLEVRSLGYRTIQLIIKDNGRGLDHTDVNRGNGLSNIRKRAGRIGGKLVLENGPASGLSVVLELNIPQKAG